MSTGVSDAVWRMYAGGGGELLLALLLADYSNDDGTGIYPSVTTMAAKTRQSERTVQYQLRKMETQGWLIRVARSRGGRRAGAFKSDGYAGSTTEYRINPDWIAEHVLASRMGKVFHAKGAKSAPLKSGPGSVDSSADAASYGADSAPLTETKGATDDSLGCNSRQLRVQQLLHPNQRDPSENHKTVVVVDCAREREAPFSMHEFWHPGPDFDLRLLSANVPQSTFTAARLAEFVSYWQSRPEQFNQAGWEHKLFQRLQLIRTRMDLDHGGELPAGDFPPRLLATVGVMP